MRREKALLDNLIGAQARQGIARAEESFGTRIDSMAALDGRPERALRSLMGEARARSESQWLDGSNCHSAVLAAVWDSRPMIMIEMVRGQRCGLCRGSVGSPLCDYIRSRGVPAVQPRLGP